MHVWWAHLYARIDPLQGHLAGEKVDLVSPGHWILFPDRTRALRLQNRLLVWNLLPRLLVRVDLVDLKVELSSDHWRPSEKVQAHLAILQDWHQSSILSCNWLT